MTNKAPLPGESSAKKDPYDPEHQSGGSPIQNAFIASKAKEEVFLKNNLEYEQRLKTHLYQFEDQEGRKRGNQSMDDISQASERQESRVYNHH